MSLLITCDIKNNIIIRPEVLKLVDSFAALNEKEMIFVILSTDYFSIYRQFPEHERRRKAMWHAFEDNEVKIIESQRIKDAISDYMSLQYNPKIELARKYQQRIDKFSESMEMDDSPTSIKKTIDAIAALRMSINALDREVDEETLNEGVVKGKMTLSLLEKVMANQKLYKSITVAK